jgi:uncharacterized protein with ParB-like and HNH nuclease domain
LGSIVLHKNGDTYNIIDGQQRITTMQILGKIINPNVDFNVTYSHPITFKHIKENFVYYSKPEKLEKLDLNFAENCVPSFSPISWRIIGSDVVISNDQLSRASSLL